MSFTELLSNAFMYLRTLPLFVSSYLLVIGFLLILLLLTGCFEKCQRIAEPIEIPIANEIINIIFKFNYWHYSYNLIMSSDKRRLKLRLKRL